MIDSGVTTATANVCLPAVDRPAVRERGRGLPREPGPRRGAHRQRPSTRPSPVWSSRGRRSSRSSIPRATARTSPAPSSSPPTTTWGFAGIAYAARLLPVKLCFCYWDFQFYLSAIGQPGFVDSGVRGRVRRPPTSSPASRRRRRLAPRSSTSASAVRAVAGLRTRPSTTPSRRGAFVAMAVRQRVRRRQSGRGPGRVRTAIQGAISVGAVGPRRPPRLLFQYRRLHLEIVAPGGDSAIERAVAA